MSCSCLRKLFTLQWDVDVPGTRVRVMDDPHHLPYQRDWEDFLVKKRSLKDVKKSAREMGKRYGFKANF